MRHSFSSVLPEGRDARAGQTVALREVTKVYRPGGGAVTALNRVTLGFQAGTFTAVMGPSG
jgi:putative ABC transport system ATP-binding protein